MKDTCTLLNEEDDRTGASDYYKIGMVSKDRSVKDRIEKITKLEILVESLTCILSTQMLHSWWSDICTRNLQNQESEESGSD